MRMFSKTVDSADARNTGTKRDVTIVNVPKKRPDHVYAETDDCTWKIPLTLEEQFSLGQVYERADFGDEEQMLRDFIDHIYQGPDGGATRVSLEIGLLRPGEVQLSARGSGARFNRTESVRYENLGRTICEWLVEAQVRKDLVSDLVSALSDKGE